MSLFQSRKFWIAVMACIVDVATVVVSQFAPNQAEFVFGIVTPVTVLAGVVIAGIAVEDSAALKAGTHVSQGE